MVKHPKKLRRALRKFEAKRRGLDRFAANSPTGLQRPLCRLDAQAKELGVYDEGYHCLTRRDRKRAVSIALTKAKAG